MKLKPIIEVNELLNIFRKPEVMIFDASNHKNAQANYENSHLVGAYFIDINEHLADIKSDPSKGGRHPLPDIKTFADKLTHFGISKDNHIVIYDDKNGANAAARFWWMLKSIGHEKVQVLNGGLQQALKYNFPMSAKMEKMRTSSEPYPYAQWKLPTIEMDEVEKVTNDPNYLILDVRDKDRYDGKVEPIDSIAGHNPGAINVPLADNLDEHGLFLSPDALKSKYKTLFADIKPENTIVHCGSGVTACHTLLALDYAGMEMPKLYVGSWSEWSRNEKTIAKTI